MFEYLSMPITSYHHPSFSPVSLRHLGTSLYRTEELKMYMKFSVVAKPPPAATPQRATSRSRRQKRWMFIWNLNGCLYCFNGSLMDVYIVLMDL